MDQTGFRRLSKTRVHKMIPPSRSVFFPILTLILVAGVIEVTSAALFTSFRDRFTFFDPESYVLVDEDMRQMKNSYDSTLGWDRRYKTRYGERPVPRLYGDPFIATFGDSYTHCDQVEHHETWQVFLAERLQRDVYNFGSGGYGTDQAYLKYLAKLEVLGTPVVIFGINLENISRIVNVYRPFYAPHTGIRLTKPRFLLKGGRLELLPNPIGSVSDLVKLKDPEYIESLGRHDWWFNSDQLPQLKVPYSAILLNKQMWLQLYYRWRGEGADDRDPRPWENLWKDRKAVDLMTHILDAFVEKARSEEALPLLVILPTQKHHLVGRVLSGIDPLGAELVLKHCQRAGYLCFDGISAVAERVESQEQIDELFRGHASVVGNEMIAAVIHEYLESLDLDL